MDSRLLVTLLLDYFAPAHGDPLNSLVHVAGLIETLGALHTIDCLVETVLEMTVQLYRCLEWPFSSINEDFDSVKGSLIVQLGLRNDYGILANVMDLQSRSLPHKFRP